MAKEGSTVSGLMDTFATTVSVALQYGVPLRDLVNKFAHVRFEPSGFTGNQEIPIAKSIVDYIFRWLGSRFLGPRRQGGARAASTGRRWFETPRPGSAAASRFAAGADLSRALRSHVNSARSADGRRRRSRSKSQRARRGHGHAREG